MLSKKGNEMNEMKVYGMSVEDIEEQYMNSITARCSGLEMVVAGILSDIQEMNAMKNPTVPSPNVDKLICQQLNVAKFILFKIMDTNREEA